MNICLFTPDEIDRPLPLCDERARHIVKILHKKTGDTFSAGVIGGKAGKALITDISEGKDGGAMRFSFTPETDGKALSPLTLIVGFPRPIQLKRLLRDVAGLGASHIRLTGTELGEKSYMQSSLVERGAAYKMLLDGSSQAGSTHVPRLSLHETLAECLREEDTEGAITVALDNVNAPLSLTAFLSKKTRDGFFPCPVIAAIGSERGWTDAERAMFERHGYTRCSMGERILRTETAATVAASIILAAMGKLG